jgi:hypothetical protein
MGGVDASGLDDTSFFGDIAVEDGEAAILAEGVREVADDSGVAVEVEIGIAGGLAEGDGGADAEGRGAEELVDGGGDAALDVEGVDGRAERGRVDGGDIAVEQAGAIQFAEDGCRRRDARPPDGRWARRARPCRGWERGARGGRCPPW